jgi:hypothetical protein
LRGCAGGGDGVVFVGEGFHPKDQVRGFERAIRQV